MKASCRPSGERSNESARMFTVTPSGATSVETTRGSGAVDAAERVRERLAAEEFEGRTVTASIGAAQFPVHGDTPTALVAAADAALYQAKEAGRDRVVAAPIEEKEAPPKDPKTKRRKKPAKKAGGTEGEATAAKKKAAPKKKASSKEKPGAKKKSGGTKKASTAEEKAEEG